MKTLLLSVFSLLCFCSCSTVLPHRSYDEAVKLARKDLTAKLSDEKFAALYFNIDAQQVKYLKEPLNQSNPLVVNLFYMYKKDNSTKKHKSQMILFSSGDTQLVTLMDRNDRRLSITYNENMEACSFGMWRYVEVFNKNGVRIAANPSHREPLLMFITEHFLQPSFNIFVKTKEKNGEKWLNLATDKVFNSKADIIKSLNLIQEHEYYKLR